MDDLINESPQAANRHLNKRFIVSAISLIIVLALLASAATYLHVRYLTLQQDLTHFNHSLSQDVFLQSDDTALNQREPIQLFGDQLVTQERIVKLSVYTPDIELLWASDRSWLLNANEKTKLSELLASKSTISWVWDDLNQFINDPSFGLFVDVVKQSEDEFITLSVIVDASEKPVAVLKSLRNYSNVLQMPISVALACFVIVCFCGSLVTFIFTRLFRKSTNLINSNETILNNQVTKLSMLLDENKELQLNMKSASSRAVELNERFLRRVGSDLHDGPAQSIGYAMLRLNQVSSKQISDELGHEFHAVKEALNESLEEIRGISSGLVLPELEHMTLEEAIHKVIERHKMNTGTEVKEFYLNLPDNIALPIKICAYRFAQEGLNNAYKHGNAQKCRFTAQLTEGVLHLSLKDNGMGFRMSLLNTDGGHLGLVGLKDRIESLGGKLSINSELGVGTAIKVSVRLFDYN